MAIFTGAGVAIITPFLPNGEINYDCFGKLIDFQIENSADAIVACGTTGEASTLTDEEQIEAIRFVVQHVNKRVPVIAGAGSNYTAHGVDLCVSAQKAGADALLLVTPYYNKTTQKGLVEHYTEMAKTVDLPVILYNVPGRTGMNITAETTYELSKIENIVGTKEASGNMTQIATMANLCGDDFAIYSGNDDQILPIMSLGGKGVISVLANIAPQQTHNMVHEYLKGNVKEATRLQLEAMPLVNALFCEVNPIPVKAAVNMMGMGFEAGGYRKPLTEMSPSNQELLKKCMIDYGLIQ